MITDLTIEEQEKWLVQKGNELGQEEDKEDNAVMAQARILYDVWSIWSSDHNPTGQCLSNEAKWKWGYDFYKWAKSYTKRRAGREPANITIDNKISVYRDFIKEESIEAPARVLIPKRDEYGELIDPELEDENAWEEIEPDFSTCDYGKLLVARGAARRGDMKPEAWAALFDPHASVVTLKAALNQVPPSPSIEDTFYLKEEDGIIYACDDATRVPVFQVLFENESEGELFTRGLCHVLRACGLHVPLIYQSK